MSATRIAVVLSHPIQHFAPQFRSWSALDEVELKVFYGSSQGARPYHDRDFGRQVSWGPQVTEGYDAVLLDAGNEQPATVSPRLDAPSLPARLDEFEPQILITYGYAQLLQFRARRWAMRRGIHLAYVSDSENRHKPAGKRSLAKRISVRRFLKPYGSVLTVGDANEDYYRSIGVESTRFVRMGFPIDRDTYEEAWLHRDALRLAKRRQLGIADDETVALVVGKLISRKRQRDAVQAAQAADAGPPIRIILAGSGPDEDALTTLAARMPSKHPLVLGFVPPDELPALYAAADVYVHPSSMDPHPLAVSEAIYMGLPVIVSRSVGSWGPSDDVIEGANGHVFPTGDVGALHGHILKLASDLDLRRKLGQTSRSLASRYQERAHGAFLEELICRIHPGPVLPEGF